MEEKSLYATFPDLHEGQRLVALHPARFKVLAAGRRWGKSKLAAFECIHTALNGGIAWWVAPSYKMAAVGWRNLKAMARHIPGISRNISDRTIWFPGDGWVQVRSAHDPDSLRGDGLDFLVIDEAAFMRASAWTEALRPALSDRNGRALIISTPRGRNWFWKAFQRGLDPLITDWQSWHFPTSANPTIPAAEIEAARDQLPEDIFKQEYLAEFIENRGMVFRNLDACMNAPLDARPEDHAGHYVAMGVDWGRAHDYTVLSVGCAECKVELALDRFNQIDYVFQSGRLKALKEKWGVRSILAEENSIGEVLIMMLRREGLRVEGFQTTADSKPPLIQNMALALERAEWQFLNHPVATAELQSYEYKANPYTGRARYSAPHDGHDDTVIARALLLWEAKDRRIVRNVREVLGIIGEKKKAPEPQPFADPWSMDADELEEYMKTHRRKEDPTDRAIRQLRGSPTGWD